MKNLTAKQLDTMLSRLGACSDGQDSVQDKTLAQAWRSCIRPDWMMWLTSKVLRSSKDQKLLTLAACACVRLALKYLPASEKAPLIAIRTAEKWARGEVSWIEMQNAAKEIVPSFGASRAAYYVATQSPRVVVTCVLEQDWAAEKTGMKQLANRIRRHIKVTGKASQ